MFRCVVSYRPATEQQAQDAHRQNMNDLQLTAVALWRRESSLRMDYRGASSKFECSVCQHYSTFSETWHKRNDLNRLRDFQTNVCVCVNSILYRMWSCASWVQGTVAQIPPMEWIWSHVGLVTKLRMYGSLLPRPPYIFVTMCHEACLCHTAAPHHCVCLRANLAILTRRCVHVSCVFGNGDKHFTLERAESCNAEEELQNCLFCVW